MMQRFIDRIDNLATRGRGGFWTCMALFWAAALGFQLAAFRFGHLDVTQLTAVTAFLLFSALYLVKQRWLRVLLFVTSVPLLIIALIMLIVHPSHAR
jgi:hypothetical protein